MDASEIANVRADTVKDRRKSYRLIFPNPAGHCGELCTCWRISLRVS